jgi:hypothetical protein
MNVRDVSIVSDDTQPVLIQEPPVVGTAAAQPEYAVIEAPRETVQVRTTMTFSPAALVACLEAIALLLFGAINLARAGVDGPWRDPIVEVAGYQGTAVLGVIVLVAGLALLGAAFSRDRGAILFMAIVLGVAGATLAIEPTVGGELISAEEGFGVAVLIMAAFLAFVAAIAPSVRRTSNRFERA